MTTSGPDPWAPALVDLGLDDVSRPDFGATGLALRLGRQTVQVAVIPVDADRDRFELTSEVWDLLDGCHQPVVGSAPVDLGSNIAPTAHAACRYNGHSGRSGPWLSYVAFHRTGVVSAGFGDHGATLVRSRDENEVLAFRLVSIVGRIHGVLQLHAAFVEHCGLTGPFDLAVGIRGAAGSVLAGFGEGWLSPFDFAFDGELHPCPVDNLLWRLRFDEVDGKRTASGLAAEVGNRLEGAWGGREGRYFDRAGAHQGTINPGRN
jgi:hypothetical protein